MRRIVRTGARGGGRDGGGNDQVTQQLASMLSADWACWDGYGEGYGFSTWPAKIGGEGVPDK